MRNKHMSVNITSGKPMLLTGPVHMCLYLTPPTVILMSLHTTLLAVPIHNKVFPIIFVQGQWKIVFQFLPNNNINTMYVPYYKLCNCHL